MHAATALLATVASEGLCDTLMTTSQHVLNCSFERWYPSFKSVSFRSQIVPLPKDFADYLVQDGVYLPDSNSAVRVRACRFVSFNNRKNVQSPCDCNRSYRGGLPLIQLQLRTSTVTGVTTTRPWMPITTMYR